MINTKYLAITTDELEQYVCPITKKIMLKPVIIGPVYKADKDNIDLHHITSGAYTFEKTAIVQKISEALANRNSAFVELDNGKYKLKLCEIIKAYEIEFVKVLPLSAELKHNKLYIANNNIYCMLNPQGIEKKGDLPPGMVANKISLVEKNLNILNIITQRGHNIYLKLNASKKYAITKLLEQYPELYCKLWQNSTTGNTLLHNAIWQNYTQTEWLLENHDKWQLPSEAFSISDLISATNNNGDTLLHFAVLQQNEQLVSLLLGKYKADINAKNNAENTPLHLAVAHLADNIFNKLLINEAEINTVNNLGDTALHLAVHYVSPTKVASLLAKQAKPDIKNNLNYTPIAVCALKILSNSTWEPCFILDLLLNKEQELLPLHLAIELADHDLLHALLKLKNGLSYIKKANNEQQTPLYVAAKNNDLTAINLLIGKNVSLTDMIGPESVNILHVLMQHQDCIILKTMFLNNPVLLKNIINHKDANGNTALHLAVLEKNKTAIEILIQNSADCLAKNNTGKMPTDLALEQELQNYITLQAVSYNKQQLLINVQKYNKNMQEFDSIQSHILQPQFSNSIASRFEQYWQVILNPEYIAINIEGKVTIKDLLIKKDTYIGPNHSNNFKCIHILNSGDLITVVNQQEILIRYKHPKTKCLQEDPVLIGKHDATIACVREITHLEFTWLVTSSIDGIIKIWDMKSKLCLYVINTEQIANDNCAYEYFSYDDSKDLLVCATGDGKLQFWQLGVEVKCSYATHITTNTIHSLMLLPNNNVAFGLADYTNMTKCGIIEIFEINSKQSIAKLAGFTAGVDYIGLYKNQLVSSSVNEIIIWDLDDYTVLKKLEAEPEINLRLFLQADNMQVVKDRGKHEIEVLKLEDFIQEKDKSQNETGYGFFGRRY